MKVGIIVYSQTGNTKYVAGKIKEELLAQGIEGEIMEVKATEHKSGKPESNPAQIILENIPDPSLYDMLILGSPVHAFCLSKVFTAYLMKTRGLKNKPVFCFITQGLSFAFPGKNALRQMKKLALDQGAKIISGGNIPWGKNDREERISVLAKEVAKAAASQGQA